MLDRFMEGFRTGYIAISFPEIYHTTMATFQIVAAIRSGNPQAIVSLDKEEQSDVSTS